MADVPHKLIVHTGEEIAQQSAGESNRTQAAGETQGSPLRPPDGQPDDRQNPSPSVSGLAAPIARAPAENHSEIVPYASPPTAREIEARSRKERRRVEFLKLVAALVNIGLIVVYFVALRTSGNAFGSLIGIFILPAVMGTLLVNMAVQWAIATALLKRGCPFWANVLATLLGWPVLAWLFLHYVM